MYEIRTLPEFDQWLKSLKDSRTIQRLSARLRKVSLGHLGDVKSVGTGVYEMREHFGAGYRMYYVMHQNTMVIMLGGGDKKSQQRDINKAIRLAQQLEE